MPNTHFFRLSIMILIIGFPQLLFSQQNMRPGLIITNEQDTIYGEIDFRTDPMNAKQCVFRQEGQDSLRIYFPFEIAGYRFTDDGKYYVSRFIRFNPKEGEFSVFLEYLLKGMHSLYYYENKDNESAYYIECDGKLIKADAPVIEEKRDGITYREQPKRYIPVLQYVFKDYPKLKKKIARMPYEHKSFINVTKEYHYAMCKTGEDCIEFETTGKPGMSFEITPYIGLMYYTSRTNKFLHQPNIYGGINLAISNIRWNRSISGIIDVAIAKQYHKRYYISEFSNTVWTDIAKRFISMLRLGARYTFNKRNVQPFLEFGPSFYPTFGQGELDEIYVGLFAGIGSKFRIPKTRKQAITLRLQGDKISTIPGTFAWAFSASLGYTF